MPAKTATANLLILLCCMLGSFLLVYMSKSLYWKLDSYGDVGDVRTFQRKDLMRPRRSGKLAKIPKPQLKKSRERKEKRKQQKEQEKERANKAGSSFGFGQDENAIKCADYDWNQLNMHKGIMIFTLKQCESYELLTQGRSLKPKKGAVMVDRRVELTGCPSGVSLDYDSTLEDVTEYCTNQTDGKLYNLGRKGPYAASVLGTHASNILELKDGTLAMTSFYGVEGSGNVSIVFSKFSEEELQRLLEEVAKNAQRQQEDVKRNKELKSEAKKLKARWRYGNHLMRRLESKVGTVAQLTPEDVELVDAMKDGSMKRQVNEMVMQRGRGRLRGASATDYYDMGTNREFSAVQECLDGPVTRPDLSRFLTQADEQRNDH